MKFKLSVKNLLIIISSIVSAWVIYVSMTQSPDIVLFEMFGYKCGINFTTGAYAKLLMVGCWMLTIMMTRIVDEEKQKQNA